MSPFSSLFMSDMESFKAILMVSMSFSVIVARDFIRGIPDKPRI
jgi:hypothetical protein